MKHNFNIIRCFLLIAFLTGSAGSPSPAQAQAIQHPRRTPIVEAFQKNKDAVVSITGKQLVRESNPFWGFEDWGLFRPRLQARPFLGSGFVLDNRGYVVTNAHVVSGALEVTVIMADGSQFPAETIVASESLDMALLKIEPKNPLPTVQLGRSDDLMIGETVLAIGNPFGYQHTLTDGIISAVHRDMQIEDKEFPNLIQISAPINPGNSGGPLLNINGYVIGMNTAIRRAAEAIGFAIPVDQLRENLAKILYANIQDDRRIDFGAKIVDFPPPDNQTQILILRKGVLIQSVRPDSAADLAGLRSDDVITAVAGTPTNSAINFYLELLEQKLDQKIEFEIWRKQNDSTNSPKKQLNISVTLKERPKPDAADLALNMFGINVHSLTERQIDNYGGAAEPGYIAVSSVVPRSPADNSGIVKGDLIMVINNTPIQNLDSLGYKLETISQGSLVNITVYRSKNTRWGREIWKFDAKLKAQSPDKKNTPHQNRIDL
ncbi:MAG: trypsin-like peptidase domain-containing protein [Sedimentisphaerales bacterium]|nr:trypsin-like peptidase domain-containing protein [Sedimentisphaerales bacterium]